MVNANITTIPTGMFSGCKSLKTIVFPESITTIKENALRNCTALYDIKLPQNLLTIEDGAFSSCSSLKEITIPQKITSIEKNTFLGCSSLTKVTIPKSFTNIGDYAFHYINITQFDLPATLLSLGEAAFMNCQMLDSINYEGNTYMWNQVTKGSYWDFGAGSLTSVGTYTMNFSNLPCVVLDSYSVKVQIISNTSPTLVVACFDNEKCTDVRLVTITENTELSILSDGLALDMESGNTLKAFLWDSPEGMKPLCKAQSILVS